MDRAAIQQLIQEALAHHQSGRLAEAERRYRAVLDAEPNHAEALHRMGLIAQAVGRHDVAIELLRRAVAVGPDSPEVHLNLAHTLAAFGRIEESIASCRRAINLRPGYVEAINTLGAGLMQQGKLTDAADCFKRVLLLEPADPLDAALAENNLAHVFQAQGRIDDAVSCYRRSLEHRPDLAVVHSNLLLVLQYQSGSDNAALFREHLAWAERHARPLEKLIPRHRNCADPRRRLRIGYVSPDLRKHSVACFLLPLLAARDHESFQIICYSDVSAPDAATQAFRKCSDGWCDIAGWPDERVAQRILDDQVDILVDLAGHTGSNRLKLFARKPAPLQVSYLGYQSTTGLSTIDYRLTDEHVDPPGLTEAYHSERLVRLPRIFACYQPEEGCPQVTPTPAARLGGVTFGSFNKREKISTQMLGLWARIVGTDPCWRLMIMAPGLGDPDIREHVRDQFAGQGGDVGQLDLRPSRPFLEYMASHADVDIMLDTFPFNGHTTTCHGLWMGVPIVTLAGDRYASRMGLSVLINVGLSDLVATTPQQCVQLAVQLAKDRHRLMERRGTMRDRMRHSPLLDAAGRCRSVEAAYRRMWEQWCQQRSNG